MDDVFLTKYIFLIIASLCISEKCVVSSTLLVNNTSDVSIGEESLLKKKVICYLGSSSVQKIYNDIDPNICTHIIYAFVYFDKTGRIIDKNVGKRSSNSNSHSVKIVCIIKLCISNS